MSIECHLPATMLPFHNQVVGESADQPFSAYAAMRVSASILWITASRPVHEVPRWAEPLQSIAPSRAWPIARREEWLLTMHLCADLRNPRRGQPDRLAP